MKGHDEIECKFLLSGLPGKEILDTAEVMHDTTIYLLTGDPELRIRRRIGINKEPEFQMTVKREGALKRPEYSLPADEELFKKNLSRAKHYTIRMKYKVKLANGQTWELNVYDDRLAGLLMAELEFKTLDVALNFDFRRDAPRWLKDLIIKDVTEDPRYYNQNLAVDGVPDPA